MSGLETVDRRSETRKAEGISSSTPSYQKETFSTIPTDDKCSGSVPLGLDTHEVAPEFVRVWRHGGVSKGVPSLKGLGRVASAFDTEDEAWAYRGRFAHCFTRISGPPTETTLAERFEKCKQENRRAVVLLNGKGEVLKEYPV